MLNHLELMAHRFGTDKGYSVHRYTMVYDLIFRHMSGEVKKLVEVGILKGNSLRMWQEYFYNAQIIGIDNQKEYLITDERINSYWANQLDKDSLLKVAAQIGNDIDVIIDDGSHILDDQILTFDTLYQFVKSGGIYIIEDIVDINAFNSRMQYQNYFLAVLNQDRGSVMAVILK